MAAPVKSTASVNVDLGKAPRMGVNLSGCEFVDNGALCPKPSTVDTYIDKGFTVFRVPFKGKQASDPAVVRKLQAIAQAAAARGAYVILDRHDYGPAFRPEQLPFWTALMPSFPDTTHVLIDPMNEPKGGYTYEKDRQTGKSFGTEVNAAIAGFRKAGFKHTLVIEWKEWAGMQRFDKGEAANAPCSSPACSFDRAGGLKDPIGRTMVSGHRYPDSNGSGTSGTCVTNKTGPQLVANAEKGAAARGLKLWIGEFAFGSHAGVSATCEAIGRSLIARMRAMPQVYAGVSWWGGGNGWKEDYFYKIEPKKGTFATAAPSKYLTIITGK